MILVGLLSLMVNQTYKTKAIKHARLVTLFDEKPHTQICSGENQFTNNRQIYMNIKFDKTLIRKHLILRLSNGLL